jgi:hypothetical protein
MRDADARALARAINRLAGGGISEDTLDVIEGDSSRTVTVELTDPVPVEVVYVTIEVDAGRLQLHPDIYRRDRPTAARAIAVLTSAGIDTADVDGAVLSRLIRRARSRPSSIALDSLMLPRPLASERGR